MYNLFIAADPEMWEKGFAKVEKSRFLEYTIDDIAIQFKNASEDQMNKLKDLPCLFAYERGNEKDANIGYLTSISDRGKEYFIEFDLDSKYNKISYKLIDKISVQLDIRDWELNRTHWAVKNEDLFKRINAELNVNFRSSKKDLDKNYLIDNKSSENQVSSVIEYINMIINFKINIDEETFYRGHADRNYKLVPSIYRTDKDGNFKYLESENVMFNEMILANPTEFSSDLHLFEKLVRMQHYSLPTRLLDITSNPLIALYFSCMSEEKTGEVIMFNVKKDNVKYFDSDTASCIANLSKLTYEEKNKIDFVDSIEEFNNQNSIIKLNNYIKDEKPYFKSVIKPQDIKKIICIKSKKSNNRIASQSGAFLLFGIDSVFEEIGTDDIRVDRIEVINKRAILKELDIMNINESTVFPYIESSAKYIASKFEFTK